MVIQEISMYLSDLLVPLETFIPAPDLICLFTAESTFKLFCCLYAGKTLEIFLLPET